MNTYDDERRRIRAAEARLLAGKPIRSDGKLTVTSLAVEAGFKRWRLTHRHVDLKDEFLDKVHAQGSTTDAMRALASKNDHLKRDLNKLRAKLKQALHDNTHYTRVIRVLTAELEKNSAATGITASVTPINRGASLNKPTTTTNRTSARTSAGFTSEMGTDAPDR